MSAPLTFTYAVSTDSGLLTSTAFASKKVWGYSDEFMSLWKQELEISEDYISKNTVVKVFHADDFIGFFALKATGNNTVEIDHLWLLPNKIKSGFGKQIFQQIREVLRQQGHQKVWLVAEPNAKGFYDKMGGRVTGQFESKVSGRFLDIYEFEV